MTTTTGDYLSDMGIARLNSDGSTDSKFGNAGLAIFDFDSTSTTNMSHDEVYAVNVQSDGKIVLSGKATTVYSINPGTPAPIAGALVRLTPNGLPDNDFGTAGKIVLPNQRCCTGAALQSNRLVVNGNIDVVSGQDIFIKRLANNLIFNSDFEY